jgi:ATP-dependent RNA helicase RhlE
MSMDSKPHTVLFADLKLAPRILEAVKKEGYTTPTPIQAQAIPPLLEGRDLLGQAQTGSGKTAAFALPMIDRLTGGGRLKQYQVRSLVLAPTRELAVQIEKSFRTYSRNTKMATAVVYGGVGQMPQVKALKRGAEVLVATPGRLLDLVNQGHARLDRVEVFVLDEADRMLDMGFLPDIKRIIAKLPRKRQTLFFSATTDERTKRLSREMLSDPVMVNVAPKHAAAERIEQKVLLVEQANKLKLLAEMLKDDGVTRSLVFTRTKHRADRVAKSLTKCRISAEAIHGNKSQNARQRALKAFSSGRASVLVATDVASRGIDVDGISHVFNFELPDEAEAYVHRIGRTARAGASGVAYSFCNADERAKLRDIERLLKRSIDIIADHSYRSSIPVDVPVRAHAIAKRCKRSGKSSSNGRRRRSSGSSPRGRANPGGGSATGKARNFKQRRHKRGVV